MKKYDIQIRKHTWENTWTLLREFDTLEEAKRYYEARPDKKFYRIAEAYVQVRYKPVK